MTRTQRFLIIAAVAVAGAVAGVLVARHSAPQPPRLEQATLLPEGRPLPEFQLVDSAGRPFGRADLRGHWTLMFFGFTSCPDICPTTLATLAVARRQLADLPAPDQPTVVLVSVDPGRDTPEKLAGYVAFFDPSFRGVTGTPEAITAFTRDLGVAVEVGKPGADGSYTVDHTAAVILVDPSGSLRAIFGSPQRVEALAQDYRAILKFAGG
jgi:protein SCO1/2